MTPTSTEPRRFRRAIAGTLAVLLLLCGVFLALDYFQGPKLSTASLEVKRTVAQPGQQLRLFADQNLANVSADQLSITPKTAATVRAEGQVLTVSFSDRLSYATRYTVTVRGVHSRYQEQATTFRHSFVTPRASFAYLDRADPVRSPGGLDQIISTGVSGSKRSVLYEAKHIQGFVSFPAALAVVTLNDDGTNTISLVSGRHVEKLILPGAGTVAQLQSAPEAGLLGFVFTSRAADASRQYQSTLMTMDLGGAHTAAPVPGIDGTPLAVADWIFLSGSTNIVAQAEDQTVLFIDPAKPSAIEPLGQYLALGSSSPDGKRIALADALSYRSYGVADGSTFELPPPAVGGVGTFGGELQLLQGKARVQQVVRFDEAAKRYDSYIVYADGAAIRIVFGGPDYKGNIDGFTVSPNGQYLAVTVLPPGGSTVSDGYPADPKPVSVTTLIVDLATGAVRRGVEGFDIAW